MVKMLTKFGLFAAVFMLSACASTKPPSRKAKLVNKAEWDYERIRQARMNESAQTPPPALRAEEPENCLPMPREQMIRSKASGCRPMDAREGAGPDMFCCPRS